MVELAQDKGHDLDFLKNFLGWRDGSWYNTKAVEMPYFDEDKKEARVRYRVALTGDRFRAKGTQIPYGIWNLEFIRSQGYVILEEGETDFATLTYHNYPVIGIPGAATWKYEWRNYLPDIEVFAWREPGHSGDVFIETLAQSFPDLKVITAPEEAKDPCDLAKLLGDGFKDRMEELLDQALPYAVPERFADKPVGGWFGAHDLVAFRVWYQIFRDDLETKKALFVDTLPNGTPAQRQLKQKITNCYHNYRAMKCLNMGEVFLNRLKCGEPICPFCSFWLLDSFFTRPNPAGRNKMDVLKENLDEPSIYTINIGSQRLPADRVEKVKAIAAIEKSILSMDTHLTDNHGHGYVVAKDHVRGIRVKTEGDVFHYQMILLANHEAPAVKMLKEHFAKQTGVEPQVSEIRCDGVQDVVNRFTALMALRCDWDTADNYDLWRSATKGSRLIQGKGVFSKVSGGKRPKQLGLKLSNCPVCGACEPLDLGGLYPVASTHVVEVKSEWTGKTYYTAAVEVAA